MLENPKCLTALCCTYKRGKSGVPDSRTCPNTWASASAQCWVLTHRQGKQRIDMVCLHKAHRQWHTAISSKWSTALAGKGPTLPGNASKCCH